jgi:hypothetical protein
MSVDKIDQQALDWLLDELDLYGQQQQPGGSEDYWACQRRHARHPFRVGCTVYFFAADSPRLGKQRGRTRNVSRSGIALLVRRMFSVGDPVEIEASVPDRPGLYMAGLVSFCRYVGRGYHEVGVTLKQASSEPIFSNDAAQAVDTIAWLRDIDWLREMLKPV